DNISSSPITVEIDLASTTNVNHVIVYAPRPWQQQGAPLDYYLQYYDATSSAWINIEHVQENPKTFGTYSVPNNTTVDTYYSSRSLFDHAFPAVSTSKIRLLVNSVTWGGGATQETNQAGGQTSGPALSLQEVEIYGQ
ncbi:MAG TPA: hypothetical protein VGT41_00320, partial [Candidatus Babeliales bacterium]|nr:hypothetical protein [Candidatus Babeliales bacterium]